MAIKGDKKYHGEVIGGDLVESGGGTLAYQVNLKCEDGEASYMIWLTARNRERASKTFIDVLGVDGEKLKNQTYIENQLALDITGKEVTFVTEEEEYKGKTKIKVAWLFKRSASNGNPAKAAASFFGGKSAAEITDEDIPF